VISAKATEGPHVFRRVSEEAARKWKFRPAMRDGRSVESEQTIEFRFER
jgi:outer membrane biosynthesis protein TonB